MKFLKSDLRWEQKSFAAQMETDSGIANSMHELYNVTMTVTQNMTLFGGHRVCRNNSDERPDTVADSDYFQQSEELR